MSRSPNGASENGSTFLSRLKYCMAMLTRGTATAKAFGPYVFGHHLSKPRLKPPRHNKADVSDKIDRTAYGAATRPTLQEGLLGVLEFI